MTGKASDDSVKGQLHTLIALLVLIAIFLGIGIVATLHLSSFAGITDRFVASIISWAIWLLLLSPFVVYASSMGMEVDGIYENGISSRETTLLGHLRGKGFVPYDSITAIRLERIDTPTGTTEKITVYNGDSNRPAVDSFVNSEYKNDFWNRLKNALRTNCRNAKWTVEDQP